MPGQKLTIGQTAALLGITPKAIRHYHEIGLLGEPERGESDYRLYGLADMQRIQTILRMQRLGLTLQQIRFILEADEPDALLRHLLHQRTHTLNDEIARLQDQQRHIQAFLQDDASILTPPADPSASSVTVLYEVIRPASHGLADVLIQVEGDTLRVIDRLSWSDAHADFWEQMARTMTKHLLAHEHDVILWLERYLALAAMPADDRQAQAWLGELRASRSRTLLLGALLPAESQALPAAESQRVMHLLAQHLFEHATPLQRLFIETLYAGR